jgi:hypothetical protein
MNTRDVHITTFAKLYILGAIKKLSKDFLLERKCSVISILSKVITWVGVSILFLHPFNCV